jgi:peptidyl-prolyl cis-trans isomerase D
MLTLLRKGAQTWVAKILFFLLVLSFGVWGVSGSMFGGSGRAVVSVGDTDVGANEFRLAYDRQIATMSQQFGQRLTREQARAFGVEEQVYAQLVAGAALDQQSHDMNLGLSEDRLAGLIAEDPAFHDLNGRFSRQNFASVLRNVGMTEDDYIRNRQQVAIRTQVIEALADGYVAPAVLIDAVTRHRGETRTVEYMIVTPDMIDPIGAPDEAALEAYFEENSARYRAPEYRRIAYVSLTAEEIADPSTISEETARADFERDPDRYSTPERRVVDQLIFPDREAADAAAARIADGATFDEVAEEQGRSAADIRLGSFTRQQMTNPALAEAAFGIGEAGGTSPVVDGPFGPVILRAAEIEGGGETEFADVADQIREELALVEAADLLFSVYNAFEDARAGGASLEDAATEQQLDAVVIEAVDRSGRDPEGVVVSGIPQSRDLLAGAFDSDVGIETPPITLGGDGYLWYEVLDIEAERDRTLDEVREEVAADWAADQTAAALAEKAEELHGRLAGGETLEAIAAEHASSVETRYGLQRDSDDAVFVETALAAAFGGPRGHTAVAPAGNASGQVVMQVTDIVTSASAGVEPGERQALSARAADDLLDQLVVRLQTLYPVSVNRTLGEQALSF